jgi:hypothetical protein
MALTQVQIIQSLGEALAWFEKELSWGVPAAELRHLTGRIGELYAAMITRGQMAPMTNQRGYDVISAEGDHISVKTITSSQHITVKGATFEHVDRIMVLRLKDDPDEGVSIECLLDIPSSQVPERLVRCDDGYRYSQGTPRVIKSLDTLVVAASASLDGYQVKQFENGTIQVERDGKILAPTKPYLREIAQRLGVDLSSESGIVKTTRQLGTNILKQLSQQP